MKKSAITLLILVALAGFEAKAQNTNIQQLLAQSCDSLLTYPEISAVSAGIYVNGKIYKLHKGELTKGKGNTPNDQTLYEIASLTKTFTGTLLAQAIADGKVMLDDDVRRYLPGDFPNLEYKKHPVTFRHLVTHRSRLPNIFPDKSEIFENPDFDKLPFIINKLTNGLTKKAYFEALAKVKIDTLPGTKFGYSNAGANLLGYCMENIYGMDYYKLLKHYILKPLGMKNTKIKLSAKDKKRVAIGVNAKGLTMPLLANKDMVADGGLKSTLDDMMAYIIYHLNAKHPVIKTSHQRVLHLWKNFDNGFFWQMFLDKKGTPKQIFQNGGAFGTASWLTMEPKTNTGVFIVTNQSGPKTHHRLDKVINKILKALK